MKHYLFSALVLCLAFVAASASAPAQETVQQKVKPVDLVHIGDVIDVDVVGGFEFDWRGGLTPDGFLNGFDGFGDPIPAVCRTEAEIAADVAKRLNKILREPNAIVKIVDRSGRAPARLDGAVRNPMRFGLMRAVSLRELVVIAGGITDGASGDITILRQSRLACEAAADNGSRTLTIKISELLSGKPGADPQVLSGDIVTVERALPVYVIGAVNNPRPLYSRSGLTLSQAVASAGGAAKNAEGNKVSVFRREGSETRIIDADLAKIKRAEMEDVVLKPFDIIDVASRGGGARKYPPVITAPEGKEIKAEPPLRIID